MTPPAAAAAPAPESVTAAWTLRGRLGRVFAVLSAITVLAAAVAVVAAVRFVGAGNDVINHWQPAFTASKQAYSDYLVEQNGLRSYLINPQASNLEPYTDAPAIRRRQLASIRHLVAGHASVEGEIADFGAAVTAWERLNAAPAIARQRAGEPVASSGQAGTQARIARVASTSTQLTDTISAERGHALSRRTQAGIAAAIALGLAFALFAAFAVGVWRGLHRWVLSPVDGLGAQTRSVASGDLSRPIRPAGPIELTNLANDVEGMRAQIVAELARAEEIGEDLRRQGDELARSNNDLQQFAYVASHDLSEPLRKVANFCQLLERQYADQLDDRARQYIDFAVDGAKRMQTLITDLLALSRVGRTTESFVPVDLEVALDQATATLADRMTATGASVERLTPLPTVAGDRSLLVSLLENLVGNAVKYHRDDVAPVVRLAAERDGGNWLLTVSDNGIGIDAQYAERIFAVFQRLHLRDQYGGTGIGLALCRRIVEFHGGRIWLDTGSPESGATFAVSLPESSRRAQQDH